MVLKSYTSFLQLTTVNYITIKISQKWWKSSDEWGRK